jgi:hypothetical protein
VQPVADYLKSCAVAETGSSRMCVAGQCQSLQCASTCPGNGQCAVNGVCCEESCIAGEACAIAGSVCRPLSAFVNVLLNEANKRAIVPVVGLQVQLFRMIVPPTFVASVATNALGYAVFDQGLIFGEHYEMRVARSEMQRMGLAHDPNEEFFAVAAFQVTDSATLVQPFGRIVEQQPQPTPAPTPPPTPLPPTPEPTPVPAVEAIGKCDDVIEAERARFVNLCRNGARNDDPCDIGRANCYNSHAQCVAALGLPGNHRSQFVFLFFLKLTRNWLVRRLVRRRLSSSSGDRVAKRRRTGLLLTKRKLRNIVFFFCSFFDCWMCCVGAR